MCKQKQLNRNYTVTEEYCGHIHPKWVLRHAGDFLATFNTRAEAIAQIPLTSRYESAA